MAGGLPQGQDTEDVKGSLATREEEQHAFPHQKLLAPKAVLKGKQGSYPHASGHASNCSQLCKSHQQGVAR